LQTNNLNLIFDLLIRFKLAYLLGKGKIMTNHHPSRRSFLQSTAALSTVGLFPLIKISNAEDANDRLRFAAIGVGGRGTAIAKGAKRFAELTACCDVDRSNARKFSTKSGDNCKMYKDYRKVFENEKIDFVTIGTPDHWHTKIAIEAMQAGLDVYCEKPLTLTIDEGKLICKVVKETGRVFQVGTQQRSEYGSKFLRAIALARNGKLGKNLTMFCSIGTGRSGGPFKITEPPVFLDWDFWLGQAPKVDYIKERTHSTFRWWFEYSGGKNDRLGRPSHRYRAMGFRIRKLRPNRN
jgi:myo-inositol 2-dehydrogenase/D-chiro-inositol 1-dehydrogenase